MKKKTKHLSRQEQCVYVCAFRYALGRATATPGVIMEEIEKVRDSIDTFFLGQMVCEIRHAVEHNLVDEYWKDKWAKFADELNEYLIERGKQEVKE
jgi:hypothetical protein